MCKSWQQLRRDGNQKKNHSKKRFLKALDQQKKRAILKTESVEVIKKETQQNSPKFSPIIKRKLKVIREKKVAPKKVKVIKESLIERSPSPKIEAKPQKEKKKSLRYYLENQPDLFYGGKRYIDHFSDFDKDKGGLIYAFDLEEEKPVTFLEDDWYENQRDIELSKSTKEKIRTLKEKIKLKNEMKT